MEVVKSVSHDVSGVHGLSEGAGDALHGHVPATGPGAGAQVGGDGEGKLHGDSSEEHFNTNQEVLIASRD